MKMRKMVILYKEIRGTINRIFLPESDTKRIQQLIAEGYR